MQNDLTKELGTNFIEYAVAVNTGRAIPNAKDGLKPVAKRILWGAEDKTKCPSSKPHIKAAKLVHDKYPNIRQKYRFEKISNDEDPIGQ